MRKYLGYSLIISFAIFCFSCKTDFNPNATYQDITVVYCLLNQNDSITYIKINKAFLGDANAYVMAQNPDSSSYGNNLEVKMEELINTTVSNVFTFDTTTVYNKEPGIFYAPNQVLYKCITAHLLDPTKRYRINIKNKLTGKVITSTTTLVNSFTITAPDPNAYYIDFTKTMKKSILWTSAVNGRRYQAKFRFNYSETNTANITTQKYVDWIFPDVKSADLVGNSPMSTDYYGTQFYQVLKSNIPVDPNIIKRTPIIIEMQITVAADEFSTYLDVNAPTSSIAQVRPEYTNITNGIGIFSSRYDNHVDTPVLLNLTAVSTDSLKHGQYTKLLGF